MEITQEQVEKSISAAYDSVGLINSLLTETTLSEEQTDSLNRNKEHIGIMLSKDWFLTGLTETQKSELQGIIA
jgi:hypothetical protein